MQLQPRAIDSSPNVLDAHKARNANELITVIGRINTEYRLLVGNFNKQGSSKTTASKDYYKLLTDTLRLQAELQAAHTAASTLNDSKRERCASAIRNINRDLLTFKRTLMVKLDEEARQTVSPKLEGYANSVHDILRKMCNKVYSMHMVSTATYVALIGKDARLASGFTVSEVCIKLAQDETGFRVCFPDGTFQDAEYHRFNTLRELRSLIASSLAYDTKPLKVKVPKALKFECVKYTEYDEAANALSIVLDQATQPSEISNLLKTIVPEAKKAVGADGYEILHRVQIKGDHRTIQLVIGDRKIIDLNAAARLSKALRLNKAVAAAFLPTKR